MTDKITYNLWYRKEEGTLQEITINDNMIIGSGLDCDLRLEDEHISSQHIRVNITDEGIFITDMGSKEGTIFLNNRLSPQKPQEILPNQTFIVSNYTFTLNLKQESKASAEKALPTLHPVISSSSLESGKENEDRLNIKTSFPGQKYGWFINNARIFSIGIWVGVLIIAVATFFVVREKFKTTATQLPNSSTISTISTQEIPAIPTSTFYASSLQTPVLVATPLSVTPPGAGEILIEPISLLSENINLNNLFNNGLNIGELLELTTNITGDKIAYAYRYVALKYNDHIVTIQKTYISAETTREVEGIQYPDWSSGEIPVNFEWKPTVYYINDGNHSEIALVYPVEYGVKENEALLAVDGIFTFSDNSEERKAKAFFDSTGKMKYMLGYQTIEQGVNSPYEIDPQPGDLFTIMLEEFQFMDSETDQIGEGGADITNLPFGNTITEIVSGKIPYAYGKGKFIQFKGGTLTFNTQGLFWTTDEKYPGDYYVGFAAEDLDGNYYTGYVPILVKLK